MGLYRLTVLILLVMHIQEKSSLISAEQRQKSQPTATRDGDVQSDYIGLNGESSSSFPGAKRRGKYFPYQVIEADVLILHRPFLPGWAKVLGKNRQ